MGQEQKQHPAAAGGDSSSRTRRQAMDLRGDEEVASCLERRRRTPAWGGYFLSRPPAPLVSVFPTAVVPRSCAVWEGPVPCSVLSSVRTLEQKQHPAAAGGASSSSSTRRQAMDLR